MDQSASAARPMDRLLAIMSHLRDPENGCPWDRAQTFATIAPYTIEEAYEVADAVERGDMGDLKEELGDLLLQVVFHARMAEERGLFVFDDVVEAICAKMTRRHPHVFSTGVVEGAAAQTEAWEAIKTQERAAKGRGGGVLADVPTGLPALTRAVKLSSRAARVGFVWPTTAEVFEKLEEEVGELKAEVAAGSSKGVREELGDVLFVCANLARDLGVEPEDALRASNAKFERRFAHIEASLAAQGRTPVEASLAEMDGLWSAAKAMEKAPT